MDRISIHNRNYKVRPEVVQYIKQLQAELDRLREYPIMHKVDCDVRKEGKSLFAPCTCGLDELLKKEE